MSKSGAISCIILTAWYCSLSYADELHDPTRPPDNFTGQAEVSASMFVLNAIFIGPDRKIAVINGMNKQVGDTVLGESVSEISDNSVQLTGPSGNITLRLLGNPIKSSPTCTGKGNEVCKDAIKY